MSAAAGLAFVGCRPQNPDAPAVREFIRDNWHTTVQHCTADTATLIGLPYPYTVPTAGAMFREMYYWDTFFTNEGLVPGRPSRTGQRQYRQPALHGPPLRQGLQRQQDLLRSAVADALPLHDGRPHLPADRRQAVARRRIPDSEGGVRILDAGAPDAHRTEPLRKLRIGRSGRRISGHRRQTPRNGPLRQGLHPRTAPQAGARLRRRSRIGLGLQPALRPPVYGFLPAGPQCQPLHVRGELRPLRAGAGSYGRDPGMDRQSGASPGTDTPILLRPRSETVLRLRLRQRPALRRAFGSGLRAPLLRRRTP